jgi:hypothetical protein
MGQISFPANRRRRDAHAGAGGIVRSHVPQCTRNLLRLSRDTAARLDRLTHRCSISEHPGESAAQNNIVKNIKTTEDYEDHIVKVLCEMVDGNLSLLPVR